MLYACMHVLVKITLMIYDGKRTPRQSRALRIYKVLVINCKYNHTDYSSQAETIHKLCPLISWGISRCQAWGFIEILCLNVRGCYQLSTVKCQVICHLLWRTVTHTLNPQCQSGVPNGAHWLLTLSNITRIYIYIYIHFHWTYCYLLVQQGLGVTLSRSLT